MKDEEGEKGGKDSRLLGGSLGGESLLLDLEREREEGRRESQRSSRREKAKERNEREETNLEGSSLDGSGVRVEGEENGLVLEGVLLLGERSL